MNLQEIKDELTKLEKTVTESKTFEDLKNIYERIENILPHAEEALKNLILKNKTK